MAKESGKNGALKYGTAPTNYPITGWEIDKSIEVLNVSDSSSTGGKDFIPDGLYEIEGSFTAFFDSTASPPTFGSEISLKLYQNSTNYWSGNGIITKENEKLQITGGEAVTISYSFKGTGAWTKTSS